MIRPISISNNLCFGAKNKTKNKPSLPKPPSPENGKNYQNGVLTGMMLGAMLAVSADKMIDNKNINSLMEDMKEEMSYSKKGSLQIKDITKDGTADIVLVDDNGDETVYDFSSGKVFYKTDDELIEKLR